MKKLIFLLMAFASLACYSQRTIVTDSIPFPAGTDTTVYIANWWSGGNWSISFNYGALDDVDGTLDLGGVDINDGSVFNRLDDLRLPYTLADSTLAFEKSYFSFKYLVVKFTVNSCTSGTITYYVKKL